MRTRRTPPTASHRPPNAAEDLRAAGTSDNVLVRITLTNATTITATRGATTNDVTVSWELTERY